MTTDDHVLESRGERRIVERFCDERLRKLWRDVWRSLPAAAIDGVYAALGDGEHTLLVTDNSKENRPAHYLGQAARIGAHMRLHLDYFHLDDYSDGWVRAVAAHELAHVVAGHLGAPKAPDPLLTAERVLSLLPNRDGQYAAAAGRSMEEVATELAASWGYPEPGIYERRSGRRPAPLSEWTKRR